MAKKETIADMFDAIAHRYDLLNHVLSLNIDKRWRKKLVRELYREPVEKVLDVATGTGDVAFAIARAGDASVEGCDISVGMLDFARKKSADRKLDGRLRFSEGDAEALGWDDGSFDAVTVAFGVRNFEDLHKGLSEMLRVLRPGGRALILEFSNPRGNLFARVYRWYSRHVLPRLGRWISGDDAAYTYLPESVRAFPDGEAFLDVMRECGYERCQEDRLSGGIATLYTGSRPG